MWEQKWWDSHVSVALRYKYNKIRAKRKKSVSKMYGNGCSDFINISQCESRIYFMWFDRSICCCCCCFCCCCPFNIVLPYSWVLCWDGLLFYFLTSASNKTRSFSIFLSLSLPPLLSLHDVQRGKKSKQDTNDQANKQIDLSSNQWYIFVVNFSAELYKFCVPKIIN